MPFFLGSVALASPGGGGGGVVVAIADAVCVFAADGSACTVSALGVALLQPVNARTSARRSNDRFAIPHSYAQPVNSIHLVMTRVSPSSEGLA